MPQAASSGGAGPASRAGREVVGPLTSALLPGFSIEVAGLFAE